MQGLLLYTYIITNIFMTKFSLLANERVASIRDVQKNPSAALRGITRVTRGSQTIGFFLSNEDFAELVENQEAAASKAYMERIRQARRQLKTSKTKSLKAVAATYGIRV